ncbi:RecT-like DNA pairing protein [Arthrobacter phage Hirko]|nr:RecT-like DNA pairing protein [Arthrobacter phage Hirko]
MTELALNPATPAGLAVPTSATVVDLAMWAAELDAAYRIGQALASTDFIPLSLKTKSNNQMKEPEQIAQNAAACILAGKALGLDPMNSVQNIFVVHGRPAMYARTMAALVLAAGHELERVAATEQRVAYRGRRKGSANWTEFEWTIARATKAGYTKNAKYLSDPIAMLTAKCQAEAARVIAPDVLTGIAATSVEEVQLEDLGESTGTAAVSAAPADKPATQRQRQRQQPAAIAPAAVATAPRDETPVDPEADAAAEAEDLGADQETGEMPEPEPRVDDAPAEALCTPEQQTALQAALKAAGFPNRAALMKRVSEFAGRPIASSKQLTETEAAELTGLLYEEADAKAAAEAAPPADAA